MKSRGISRSAVSEMAGCCCKTSPAVLTTPAVKSGHLNLLVKGQRLSRDGQSQNCSFKVPVTVKVYNNGFGHYAVLQKDNRRYCRNSSVYLNLRNCGVVLGDTDKYTFYVSSTISEGNSLVFQADNLEDLKHWLSAFTRQDNSKKSSCHIARNLSPAIPRSSLLPTLTEESEEE